VIDELKEKLKKAYSDLDKANANVMNAIGSERRQEFPLEECLANSEKARNEWSKTNKEVQSIRQQLRDLGIRT
jgi:polyhydroxyalkanoate synthesis regulator phasin